jgi:hypothetical protein
MSFGCYGLNLKIFISQSPTFRDGIFVEAADVPGLLQKASPLTQTQVPAVKSSMQWLVVQFLFANSLDKL